MTYEIDEESNALVIEYSATTDKTTLVNPHQSWFFNLAGIATPTPSINNHLVTINADHFLPIDEVSIPTGDAEGRRNPMDFRTPHTVGERIEEKHQQLINGAGYDHCYVLNKEEGYDLSLAAIYTDPESKRSMEVYTTEPGVPALHR